MWYKGHSLQIPYNLVSCQTFNISECLFKQVFCAATSFLLFVMPWYKNVETRLRCCRWSIAYECDVSFLFTVYEIIVMCWCGEDFTNHSAFITVSLWNHKSTEAPAKTGWMFAMMDDMSHASLRFPQIKFEKILIWKKTNYCMVRWQENSQKC